MKRTILLSIVAFGLVTPASAQEGPFGALARKDGAGDPYRISDEDVLWAARMLVGESGGEDDVDNVAVLWCMINSYMLRPVREIYPTFTAFVRAYCTPLQPYLKSQGAIDRHKKRKTPMVEVEPGKWQLVRHVQIQQRPWADLPAGARAVVERVFRGKEPSPCRNATQFCSTAVYFHDKHGRYPTDEEHAAYTREYAESKNWVWVPIEGANARSNVFFEEERFAELPERVVAVRTR